MPLRCGAVAHGSTEPFQRKYTDRQLAAICHTRFDVSPKPTLRELVTMAAAGRLQHPDGGDVAPFDLPQATAARYTQQERHRRLGRGNRPAEVSDAVEAARLARTAAWGIVQADIAQVRNMGRAKAAQIETRQQALAVVLKNMGALQKLEPGDQVPAPNAPPGDSDAPLDPERTEPPSAAERLTAQARAERSALTTTDPTEGRKP